MGVLSLGCLLLTAVAWARGFLLNQSHGLLTVAIDYMEVPITKVLGCGQSVQKAHMSAVRMGLAEPESRAGGQWAIEFLVNSHSGGKDPIKPCISDLHVQAREQPHGPESLIMKGLQAGATAGAEAKCYQRKREPSSLITMSEQNDICCFEAVRHPASTGTSEH